MSYLSNSRLTDIQAD